ncbi:Phosphotransferase enzyme family protein [Gimesia panareensis]|uniref:Phosphotransferase enzyme family protein n=1 Tax=Gimesia panareensis TaxID=2527978 RepID=A0A518FVJ2_9PLAN|nr:aminoglycoside phosphotransferase family protein [Gimesia panareensis]QDV20367.1 Phosphotransferase enzyme family protein [Gimesia panareensis]
MSHPPAEIQVDLSLVRQLLLVDYPRLADARLFLVDEGWDNFTFRAGEHHAVRLPRRAVAVTLLKNEQRWLPILAPRLSLELPLPVHNGSAGPRFPWPWSVVHWIAGKTAETHNFPSADIRLLAENLRALHQPAPEEAPQNPFRGVPLPTRTPGVEQRLHRQRHHPGVAESELTTLWRSCCETPPADESVWIHGDLHPRNVIIREGALVGLIDWGDLAAGDPATDLACVWLLLDEPARRTEFLETYGAEAPLIQRALGWALHMGLALLDSGEPRHVTLGEATLQRVLADA